MAKKHNVILTLEDMEFVRLSAELFMATNPEVNGFKITEHKDGDISLEGLIFPTYDTVVLEDDDA